jgi:hypothetical protein
MGSHKRLRKVKEFKAKLLEGYHESDFEDYIEFLHDKMYRDHKQSVQMAGHLSEALGKSPKVFKYIEIVEFKTKYIVKRIDVSLKTESQIEKIESGILINMDTDDYYVDTVKSNVELETI